MRLGPANFAVDLPVASQRAISAVSRRGVATPWFGKRMRAALVVPGSAPWVGQDYIQPRERTPSPVPSPALNFTPKVRELYDMPLEIYGVHGLGATSALSATQSQAMAEIQRAITEAVQLGSWVTLDLVVGNWYSYYGPAIPKAGQDAYRKYGYKIRNAPTTTTQHKAIVAQAKYLLQLIAKSIKYPQVLGIPPTPWQFGSPRTPLPWQAVPTGGYTPPDTIDPSGNPYPATGTFGLEDYVDGIGDLSTMGISVDVKIPRAITEAAKIAPSIARQFPAYAHELQKESARVTGTVDAINIGLQTLGVSLVVGGIVAVLLLRERPKAEKGK